MASKKSPSPLLVVGALALFIVVPVAINLLLVWPLLLVLAYFKAHELAGDFEIPPVQLFSAGRFQIEYGNLVTEYAQTNKIVWHNIEAAVGEGFALRRNQTTRYPRFDERRKHARGLNDDIESYEQDISVLFDRMVHLRAEIHRRIPAWESDFQKWRFRKSACVALSRGLRDFAAIWPFGFALIHHSVEYISNHVLIDVGLLHPLYPSTLVASFLSLFVTGWRASQSYKQLGAALASDQAKAWRKLRRRWSPEPDSPTVEEDLEAAGATLGAEESEETEYEADDPTSSSSRREPPPTNDNRVENPLHWSVVLGISRDATLAQIRKAWVDKLKINHPDLLQGFGEEREHAAEEITKTYNAAYADAQRERA